MNPRLLTKNIHATVAAAYTAGAFTEGGVATSHKHHRQFSAFPHTLDLDERLYDTASLTKVLVTWPLVLTAIAHERLSLLQTVQSILLPHHIQPLPGGQLTIAHLLTHTAGLTQTTRLDRYPSLDALPQLILKEPLEHPPGHTVRYGNRAYILLGTILESVLGDSLPNLFTHHIRSQFGLSPTAGFTPHHPQTQIVPTRRSYNNQWVQGIPHDRNAELLGGAAGHSGCFLTLHDLLTFGETLLDRHHNHPHPTEKLSFTPWYPEGSTWRGLTWRIATSPTTTIAFHHGFTGTSLFLDLQHHTTTAILTNSVNTQERHPDLAHMRTTILHHHLHP